MGVYQDVHDLDGDLESDLEDILTDSHERGQQETTSEIVTLLKERGIIWWWDEYVTRQGMPLASLLKMFNVDPKKAVSLTETNRERAEKLLRAAVMRCLRRREKLPEFNTPQHAVALIRDAKKIMVLTGAGISVSCGIPDFRSKNGIYAEICENNEYDLDDPQQMFDISYFKRDPSMFYSFAHKIFPSNFVPSPVHYFIKALEDRCKLLRNYTQNIDTLENKAGVSRVVQCHGSFATASCVQCHVIVPGSEIEKQILSQTVPTCQSCEKPSKGSKGRDKRKRKRRPWEDDTSEEEDVKLPPSVMKPSITFFGEKLSSSFDDKLLLDRDKVDLLLIIGTSLNVTPVSEIIYHIPHNVPQILINKTIVKHGRPDIVLLGDADHIIQSIAVALKWQNSKILHTQSPDLSNPLSYRTHNRYGHIHFFKGAEEDPNERLMSDLPSTRSLKLGPGQTSSIGQVHPSQRSTQDLPTTVPQCVPKREEAKARSSPSQDQLEKHKCEGEIESVFYHRRAQGRAQGSVDNWTKILLFHVKWKGRSHIHNSDKPYEHLKLFKGIEVVDRYILDETRRRLAAPGLIAADRELAISEKRKIVFDLDTFKQVERIMGIREATFPKAAPSEMEYLCKWRGLGDSQATWEVYGVINAIAREQIVALMKSMKAGRWPRPNGEKPMRPLPDAQREVTKPIIEAVLGHSRDDQLNGTSDLWKENIRFHIKWKGRSHFQNSFELYDYLRDYKGMEHVRKYVKDEMAYRKRLDMPGLSYEDRNSIIRERMKEAKYLHSMAEVEMVVTAIREPALPYNEDYEMEYFCEWQGRRVEEAAWEMHSFVEKWACMRTIDFTQRVETGQRTSN